jgi:hypothetical protein
MEIQVRHDHQRGCGWRKAGGIYLVASGLMAPCGRLPIPLDVCPTCHAGIHPSRSWTWIDGDALAAKSVCGAAPDCGVCPLARPVGKVGLLWIGGQFYPMPAHWIREAQRLGISRRISAVPKNFKLGETFVFVAHREAIPTGDGKYVPAVFHVFKPQAIEYVVKDDDTPEKLDALVKRGITPVRIKRIEKEPELVF